jgi:hypothetical protein
MNSPLLRWLLNIDRIPPDAETVRIAWENPLPGWAWALLLLGAAFLAVWSYSRLAGRQSGRIMLAGVRCLILLVVLVLLSGPMLEMPRETVERDWVLVLIDRSESMRIADLDGPETGERVSRDEQARSLLNDHAEMWEQLADNRRLVWLGFHSGAFALEAVPSAEFRGPIMADSELDTRSSELSIALGQADGRRTSIGPSLEQALQRAAARPISGVVLISDGRTSEPPSRSLMRRLQADAVPVFTVPVGSSDPLADLAIRRIDSPRRAFVRDRVPIEVQIDALGEGAMASGATIRLIDEHTGEELDRLELEPGDARLTAGRVTLTAEPQSAGESSWRIVIDAERPMLVPENAERSFSIHLIDRPLRVLYVEGYPRWEYRYVKNLLVREESIDSSVMLVSADREFAQEGNTPIARLPRSPTEFADFDVVVLGDVPGGFFTPQQLEMVRDHVAERGAGLLWIAGERSTPQSYFGTALADLLPMRGAQPLTAIGTPVLMQPTELAQRLGVLQLQTGSRLSAPGFPPDADTRQPTWPRELIDPTYGWSQLRWAQRIDPARLKPTVEIIAQTTGASGGEQLPLVTLMRYGAGRSVYVATDEIWRWRYGRGELLVEQFWVQVIRMLGREGLEHGGAHAVLEVTPRRVQVAQPMRIELRVTDAHVAEERRASVAALIHNDRGETVAEIELLRQAGALERFAATFVPDTPGRHRVVVNDPALNMTGMDGFPLDALEGDVEVFAPDDEMRNPETDHVLLEQLAAATGGRMLNPDELADLPQLLPDRSVITVNPLRERLWDAPLFFILILLAFTAEWIGRKMLRLV